MYLLIAATPFELDPAVQALRGQPDVDFLLSGIGPVDAAFSLTRYLCRNSDIQGVINFGIAGAYYGNGCGMLDLCVAQTESLADLGICFADRIEFFAESVLKINQVFDLRNRLFAQIQSILAKEKISVRYGGFVTVSCASGTAKRGEYLHTTHQAICENMEGAALARVCEGMGVDFFELRCVSNMVEDRDQAKWKLPEACEKAARAAAELARLLSL